MVDQRDAPRFEDSPTGSPGPGRRSARPTTVPARRRARRGRAQLRKLGHRPRAITSDSPRQLARETAILWAIGALIAMVAVLLPHGPTVNVAGWEALAAYAAVVAMSELLIGERLPVWPSYVTQVLALAGIAAGIYFAHHSAVAFAVCSVYLLPTIFAASNYPTRLLVAYLVVQSATSAGVLLTSGVPGALAGWMALVGTTATVGVVVHLQQQALRLAAITDPLTGLENRRGFEPMLARELARCERLGHPLCVAVIDLDRFKDVNDALGHQEGDRILVGMSRAWTSALRPFDILARAGGDEFVLLLPSTGPDHAVEILGRLAAASPQPFSAGVAVASRASRVEDMLRRADDACYEAKHSGRGKVAVAPPEAGGPSTPAPPTDMPVDPDRGIAGTTE